MGIGLAFSGSGPGAVWAHRAARILIEEFALPIDMIAASSLAAAPLLLWTLGVSEAALASGVQALYAHGTLDTVEQLLPDADPLCEKPPLAVASVDSSTGIAVIYSDTLHCDAESLKTKPLTGAWGEALVASASPWKGLCPAERDGMRLCDFSMRYGCPFFPLRMAGIKRLVSICFVGGDTPERLAADQLCHLSGRYADLHLPVRVSADACGGARLEQELYAHRGQLELLLPQSR